MWGQTRRRKWTGSKFVFHSQSLLPAGCCTTSTPGYITPLRSPFIPPPKLPAKNHAISSLQAHHLPCVCINVLIVCYLLWISISIIQYYCSCARVWSSEYLQISPRSSCPTFIVCWLFISNGFQPMFSYPDDFTIMAMVASAFTIFILLLLFVTFILSLTLDWIDWNSTQWSQPNIEVPIALALSILWLGEPNCYDCLGNLIVMIPTALASFASWALSLCGYLNNL